MTTMMEARGLTAQSRDSIADHYAFLAMLSVLRHHSGTVMSSLTTALICTVCKPIEGAPRVTHSPFAHATTHALVPRYIYTNSPEAE